MNHKSIISRNAQKIKHNFYGKTAYFQGFLRIHNISDLSWNLCTIYSKISVNSFLEIFFMQSLKQCFHIHQYFIIDITLHKDTA